MVFSLDFSTLSELVRPRMLRTLSIAREKGKRERGGKGEGVYTQIERVHCALMPAHFHKEARLTWEGRQDSVTRFVLPCLHWKQLAEGVLKWRCVMVDVCGGGGVWWWWRCVVVVEVCGVVVVCEVPGM